MRACLREHGGVIPMPSHVHSCLLVKISSSGRGPACPPVIIKERRESGSGNRGISTHHFSALQRSALRSVHQPLTDLFTAQSGLCLAARCTLKSSFDTPPPTDPTPPPSPHPLHSNSLSLRFPSEPEESAQLSGRFTARGLEVGGWGWWGGDGGSGGSAGCD